MTDIGKSDPRYARHICTADDPWTPEKAPRGTHRDAHEIGEQQDGWPSGDTVRMRCPHCKVEWTMELPQ